MKIQVGLRLDLQKIKCAVSVRYNTFVKATYDQYLIASVVKNAQSRDEAYAYIDDITGSGTLNGHFKKLYDEIAELTAQQLESILNSSMYPTLMIDDSNHYDYYPQLDISVFRNKQYKQDLGKRSDLFRILRIDEDIIDHKIRESSVGGKSDRYSVVIEDDQIVVEIARSHYVEMNKELFESVLMKELDEVKQYEGKIHMNCDEGRWYMLNRTTLEHLFSNDRYYYYDKDGNHMAIRNDGVKKTSVAELMGVYVYKEKLLKYKNKSLCTRVLEVLEEKDTLSEIKSDTLVCILECADRKKAQQAINVLLGKNQDKEIIDCGLRLLMGGLIQGWEEYTVRVFLRNSNRSHANSIYKANKQIVYAVDRLMQVDWNLLSEAHRVERQRHEEDMDLKKMQIQVMIGKVASSGLREKVKRVKSTRNTKRFSKLCNELIGHVEADLGKVNSMNALDEWYEKAVELDGLSAEVGAMVNGRNN